MILEAVWFKDGKEVDWVDPVLDLICDVDNDISEIEVYNGHSWYKGTKDYDNFLIRMKKEND